MREETARLVAALTRITGDFDLAEEAVQDAVVTALERWPLDGIPASPGGWLMTAARNRAIDRIRREARGREKLAEIGADMRDVLGGQGGGGRGPRARSARQEEDERVALIFTCCHPALSREAQLALTLRAVVGLTTAEIARAFVTSEATIAQRIVRAKRKIVDAGIPLKTPEGGELVERLDQVLGVLYLMFNEGYLSSGPASAHRRDLADDAAWLASLFAKLLPDEPEVLGLVALMRLHLARAAARFDADGRLVLSREQDRSRYDRAAIGEAADLLERAGRMRRPGPYQLQAAIAAAHAEPPTHEQIDWEDVVELYDALVAMTDSPVVRLNRAIAYRELAGAAAALADVELLAKALERYTYFHATRAELLRALGRLEESRDADRRALELTDNPAERALLAERLR